ncbi:MAG: NTP transferase domain-containing protein [Bacteroidetes bacterium]|nr:NTP transferase domain-containing protein [Bacteroidota bacterium]
MHAIIPVAGIGTRLRPHTFTHPKVLLNVAGKPILGHIMDKVVADGVTSATVVVGHMSERIIEFVEAAYPKLPVDFIEQEMPLGLGHAIYTARHALKDEPILIILGDTIFDVDLRPVLKKPVSALGVKMVEDPRRFGVAEVLDGAIVRLVEKPERPTSNLAVVGLYHIHNTPLLRACLDEVVSRDIRTKGEYQLTDVLQMMIDRGERMETFPVEGWYDCGKPETMLSTNRALLEGHSTFRPMEGVVISEPVYIAPNAVLCNCVIGPNTTVGDGAEISEAVIRNSIIGSQARVGRVLLENSIIGNGAMVKGSYKRFNVGDASELEFQ